MSKPIHASFPVGSTPQTVPRMLAVAGLLGVVLAGGMLGRAGRPVAGAAARPAFANFAVGVLPAAAVLGSAPGRADRLAEVPAGTWVSIGGHVALPAGLSTAEALWVAAPGPDGGRIYGFLPATAVDIVSGHAPRLSTGRFQLPAFLAPDPAARTDAASGLRLGEDAPEAAVAAAGAGIATGAPLDETTAEDAAAEAAIGARDAAPQAAIDTQAAVSGVPIPWLPDTVARWWPLLVAAGRRHGIDPALLAIVVLVESGGGPNAVSPAGASGLMQVMPATAQDIARARGLAGFGGDQLWDPAANIDLGAWYLADQWKRFGQPGDPSGEATLALAAAAYNGGPGTVLRHLNGQALPAETDRYRTWVTGMWRERGQVSSPTFDAWWNAGGGALVEAAAQP